MFRRYFITGLLIWVPIGITLWVLDLVVTTMDLSLSLLPAGWQPVQLFGRHLPGLGALLTVLIIFVTGVLTANFLGQRLVLVWEGLLSRIPIVRTIYSSVKQVSDTLLSPQGNAFRKALLVEYPRQGSWTIGFLTGTPADEVRRSVMQAAPLDADAGAGAEMVSIYVPTTPNPTSGFFLMMRREDTIELDMSVDEALKYIVSMGVVSPPNRPQGGARGPNTKIQAEIH
jgi:uncharacterized membrane protein